jgi:uncharacterized protein YdeI (YjbR/CyaY-like superfamily)
MKPTFFENPAAFRTWLSTHGSSEEELWVGFHRKATGRPSMTWPESVDEALCFGWIDGVRKSIDERRYAIRFTPRRPGSIWSARNVGRIEALMAQGRMSKRGLVAWEQRDPAKTAVYSFERDAAELDEDRERRFRRNRKAWTFYQSQPPGYRKLSAWWIISAKRESTRERRFATLVECSEAGERVPPMRNGRTAK